MEAIQDPSSGEWGCVSAPSLRRFSGLGALTQPHSPLPPPSSPPTTPLPFFPICAILSSIWCVTASTKLGATFDEPVYIARGLEGWRTSSHAGLMRLGTMPLPIDVQTLPLHLYERWH